MKGMSLEISNGHYGTRTHRKAYISHMCIGHVNVNLYTIVRI